MSETNNKIKEELFSLFKEIKDDMPNDQLPLNNKSIQNISTLDSITLITYIKESLPLLINHKISEAITQNNNNNELSAEFDDNNNNNLRKDYSQLENQIRKIESDNRYYVQLYLKCEIQKKVLDMKLNAYQYLEDEYEHLKEKVKYESGKFLDNEKKDNEIFILRAENSSLKKEIVNLEHINKKKDKKINEYITIIKDLKNNIEKLNNKIFNLKQYFNNKNTNLTNSKNKTELIAKNNSMIELNSKNAENNFFNKIEFYHKVESRNHINNNLRKINSIQPRIIKLNRKIIFNTPKNQSMRIENNKNISNSNISINTANTQFFASIYNKMQNNNKKNVKVPLIALIKMKKRNRSHTSNKEQKTKKYDIYNSVNKKKIFKNILFSNQKTFSPESC